MHSLRLVALVALASTTIALPAPQADSDDSSSPGLAQSFSAVSIAFPSVTFTTGEESSLTSAVVSGAAESLIAFAIDEDASPTASVAASSAEDSFFDFPTTVPSAIFATGEDSLFTSFASSGAAESFAASSSSMNTVASLPTATGDPIITGTPEASFTDSVPTFSAEGIYPTGTPSPSSAGSPSDSDLQLCGSAYYSPDEYTCEAEFLCPILDGTPTSQCGGACYLPSLYSCSDGVLASLAEETATSALPSFTDTGSFPTSSEADSGPTFSTAGTGSIPTYDSSPTFTTAGSEPTSGTSATAFPTFSDSEFVASGVGLDSFASGTGTASLSSSTDGYSSKLKGRRRSFRR
ncbi:MAG: hypothetical protein Q9216_001929 [Gyalolechia sp. 2 TL-2023]